MEGQEAGRSSDHSSSLIGAMFSATKSGLSSAWNAITKDGTLAAAGRQGADELGMALKAFPDSIQVEEPGTIWNPTQGEIAAARNPDLPSPSEIARGQEAHAGPDHKPGLVLVAPTPTPSEVAKGHAAEPAGPEQAKGQSLPTPSEIARDQGNVLTQEKSWTQREIERQQGKAEGSSENDQNERAKGRSLPEEQKEREQSRCR